MLNTDSVFERPLERLIADVKNEVLNWGDQQILQYRFGFYRLPFYNDRLKSGFALHFWLQNLPHDEYPHTHIFNLTSRVLLGEVKNTIWSVTKNLAGDHRLIEPVCTDTVCKDSDTNDFCFIGPTMHETITRGGVYSVPESIFHTTQILTYPTVTLIQRGDVQPDAQPAHLVPRYSKEPLRNFDFSAMNHARALSEIKDVLALL